MPEQENITELLLEFSNGKAIAVDALLPIVYDKLKRLATKKNYQSTSGSNFSGGFVRQLILPIKTTSFTATSNRRTFS